MNTEAELKELEQRVDDLESENADLEDKIEDLTDQIADPLDQDELVDEIALAARESTHGKIAYTLLREACDYSIPTLEAHLRLLDARNRRA